MNLQRNTTNRKEMCVYQSVYACTSTYICIHTNICVFVHTDFFSFLVLVVLGLRCCGGAFSSCGKQGLLFVVVCGLLIVVASLVKPWLWGVWASVVAGPGF